MTQAGGGGGGRAPCRRAGGRLTPYVVAFAAYQALALAAWWHLLADGLHGALPAGSADPGQEVWFLGWFEHALATGINPFFSHAMFAPSGVNLLSNTSMDLIGLAMAPISATAGPVVAFDVACLAAPALSALGAFALCRRFTAWGPAAFVGGLCYGFGPFVATDLRYGHLDLTWLALPPLIVCCLHELFVVRQRLPVAAGATLGLLVVGQFFISTEMLAVSALLLATGGIVVVVARPRAALAATRSAAAGLATAVGVAGVFLAYPMWVVLAGPRHVTGPVWPHIGNIATNLAALVQPHAELAGVAFISGGNGGFLGVALAIVVVASVVALRRVDAVRLASALGFVALIASLGYRLHVHDTASGVPLPAALLGHVPLLDSIVPSRFAAAVDLCCGLVVAVAVDRLADAGARPTSLMRLAAGVALGTAAVVPLALVPFWPYEVRHVDEPAALRSVPPTPRGHERVVVVYPNDPESVSDQMVVQAEEGFTFALAEGYAIVPGPRGRVVESPSVDALWLVLAAGDLGTLRTPLSVSTVQGLRTSLHALGVGGVVVLPGSREFRVLTRAMTQVLGPPDRHPGGAAVWLLGR